MNFHQGTTAVGTKLRHARKVRGLRLRELAERVGCSESMLSKIENGKVNPSLTLLHRLSGALDLTIASLFTDLPADGPVSRAGKRPIIEVDRLRQGPGIVLERLVPYTDGHLLQANIHIIAPGGSSAGAITHRGEEIGYVLEGTVELTIDESVYELSTGDSFCFRSDRPHSYRNTGTSTARVLWVNTPPTF